MVGAGAEEMGLEVGKNSFFDTVSIKVKDAPALVKKAVEHVSTTHPMCGNQRSWLQSMLSCSTA